MKKAQSSIEYLFTYGWAILAISVAIGALAYFNFSNPQSFVAEKCELGAQITCLENSVHSNGSLNFVIRSNHDILIQIENISARINNQQFIFDNSFNLTNSQTSTINLLIDPQLTIRPTINGDLEIYFKNPNSNNYYILRGEFLTRVS